MSKKPSIVQFKPKTIIDNKEEIIKKLDESESCILIALPPEDSDVSYEIFLHGREMMNTTFTHMMLGILLNHMMGYDND